MLTILLLDFCSMPWLAWLLPFILGLALGWALWAKFQKLLEECQRQKVDLETSLKKQIADLEIAARLDHETIADLRGDVATADGRMREAIAETETLKKQLASDSKLTSNVNVDSNKMASLQGDLSNAENRIKTLSDENQSLKAKLEAASAEANRQAEEAQAAANKIVAGASEYDAKDSTSPSNIASNLSTSSGQSSGTTVEASASAIKGTPFDVLKDTQLQIFEGIGPKMEEVLNANGIRTWSDLASTSSDELRAILDKYGDQYKIIDPSGWSGQAQLATEKKWSELENIQEKLGGEDSDSKLKKMMHRLGLIKEYRKDDLKIVEGIGPKIAEILEAAGINTWQELASTPVDKIKSILEAAGDRYKLANPATWQKQAQLAVEGKFDELRAYQDVLIGGKEG
jgi:predicted flap endonuclease-1-like 5' DNA nuclease